MSTLKSVERLDKILSNWGYGTRREVKRLIHGGTVCVNGAVQNKDDVHVNLNEDTITVDGVKVEIPHDVYFVINKPKGYVCSTVSDSHPVLLELFSQEDRNRRYPGGTLGMVGRLDLDTEGLLIVTSDGNLNHRLTSPKWNVEKEYLVELRDSVDEETQNRYVERLKKEIVLPAEGKHEEEIAKPCMLIWDSKTKCRIILTEGKFHEVKRIFLALNNEVIYLKRIRINNLALDENLKSGQYRELTKHELSLLEAL